MSHVEPIVGYKVQRTEQRWNTQHARDNLGNKRIARTKEKARHTDAGDYDPDYHTGQLDVADRSRCRKGQRDSQAEHENESADANKPQTGLLRDT